MRLVGTYEERYRAEKDAGMRNAAERHDTCPDRPPRLYYYVRPVTEKQLLIVEKEKFRRSHGKYRKQLAQKHGKVLKPLAKEMVAAILFCIETCEEEHRARLRHRGGWLDGYKGHADGIGDIICSLFYPGVGEIALVVTIEHDGERNSQEVETFGSEQMLKSWLLNTKGSASACENRIVNIIYDMMLLRVQQEEEYK